MQIDRLPGAAFRLVHGGVIRRAQVLSPRAAELLALMPEKQASDTSRLLLSPMPGLLSSVVVEPGQEVKAGEPLAVVEAMKMENVLRAERDGRIARIRANPGDSSRGRPGYPRIRMMAPEKTVRLRITGEVQGVGYRIWAIAHARRASGCAAGCATAPTAASRRWRPAPPMTVADLSRPAGRARVRRTLRR